MTIDFHSHDYNNTIGATQHRKFSSIVVAGAKRTQLTFEWLTFFTAFGHYLAFIHCNTWATLDIYIYIYQGTTTFSSAKDEPFCQDHCPGVP